MSQKVYGLYTHENIDIYGRPLKHRNNNRINFLNYLDLLKQNLTIEYEILKKKIVHKYNFIFENTCSIMSLLYVQTLALLVLFDTVDIILNTHKICPLGGQGSMWESTMWEGELALTHSLAGSPQRSEKESRRIFKEILVCWPFTVLSARNEWDILEGNIWVTLYTPKGLFPFKKCLYWH